MTCNNFWIGINFFLIYIETLQSADKFMSKAVSILKKNQTFDIDYIYDITDIVYYWSFEPVRS